MKSIVILGTKYKISQTNERDDCDLEDNLGYHNSADKVIAIDIEKHRTRKGKNCTFRHEVIHAYLHESGLAHNCRWHNEEMVDWLALQFPKIIKTFKELKILD